MRKVNNLFYFYGGLIGTLTVADIIISLLDFLYFMLPLEKYSFILILYIVCHSIAIIFAYKIAKYLRKKESTELSEQLGIIYEASNYFEQHNCIINFINEKTNEDTYAPTLNILIAEFKSKSSVVNVTTLLSVVIAIFILIYDQSVILHILLLSFIVVTYAFMYYLREYAYIQSILESLPKDYTNFIEDYKKNDIHPEKEAHPNAQTSSIPPQTQTATFDVSVQCTTSKSIKNYVIQTHKITSDDNKI